MQRRKYYLCRYRRTEKFDTRKGFHDGVMSDLPIAPSYIYELYRDGGPLYLTADEAMRLDNALSIEGCPHLMLEDEAIEGKPL